MPLYDSVVSSLATAGTGGFSVKNASIAAYQNPAAEWIIAIFMLLFGVNFSLYFFLLVGRVRDVIRNEELRVYLFVVLTATVVITVNTLSSFATLSEGIRAAFFQVTSIVSTTGFSTTDFNLWPMLSKMVLLLLLLLGASAGSTAGGLKVSRVIILFKKAAREIKHVLRPRSVNVSRLDGEPIPDETCRTAANYLAIWLLLIVVVFMLISVCGFGFETDLTAVLTCVNNVGPGLGVVGPAGNFGAYPIFSKLVLSLAMLFGRLEIIPMIILFSRSTWRKR
jgi:trk system potassium uptake protein TrkH